MNTFTIPTEEDVVFQLAEYQVELDAMTRKMDVLVEAVEMPDENKDIFAQMRDINAMMDAARKGLGIANKLRDPEMKKKHRSTVMANLNKIGGRLRTLAKKIDAHWESWRRTS